MKGRNRELDLQLESLRLGIVFIGRHIQRQTQVCSCPLFTVLWAVHSDLGRTECQIQRGAVALLVELFIVMMRMRLVCYNVVNP